MNLSDQYYSQFREAMFVNHITASDLAQARGVHYTGIYNTIRKNGNVTLKTAEELASAAGYDLKLTFVPRAGNAELTGTYDPKGSLYSDRRENAARGKSDASVPSSAEGATVELKAETASIEAEVEALLSADA